MVEALHLSSTLEARVPPEQQVHRVGFVIFPSRRMALEPASDTQKKKGLLKDTLRGLLAAGADPRASAPPSAISNRTWLITCGEGRSNGDVSSAWEGGGAP